MPHVEACHWQVGVVALERVVNDDGVLVAICPVRCEHPVLSLGRWVIPEKGYEDILALSGGSAGVVSHAIPVLRVGDVARGESKFFVREVSHLSLFVLVSLPAAIKVVSDKACLSID